jgi:chemotaxis protein methyltransferase CheR
VPPAAKPPPRAEAAPAPPPEPLFEALTRAYRRGDYAEVCRRSADLQNRDADYAAAALTAARACANLGKLDAALAWTEKVIARRRLDPEGHYLRAMILDEQGRAREALDALRTTLFLDPGFLPAYVAVGNICRAAGDRGQADRHFRNALVLLERYGDDDPVPHAEEMRAGSLREAVMAALGGHGDNG